MYGDILGVVLIIDDGGCWWSASCCIVDACWESGSTDAIASTASKDTELAVRILLERPPDVWGSRCPFFRVDDCWSKDAPPEGDKWTTPFEWWPLGARSLSAVASGWSMIAVGSMWIWCIWWCMLVMCKRIDYCVGKHFWTRFYLQARCKYIKAINEYSSWK